MPDILGGSVLQLSFRLNAFGCRIRHVRSFRVFGTVSVTGTVQSVQDAFIDLIKTGGTKDCVTPYLACLAPQANLEEIRAQFVYPVRYAYSYLNQNSNGTNANAATTANVHGTIEASTAFAGRNQVASYKIGPIGQGSSTDAKLTVAQQTLMQAYADTFVGIYTTPGPDAVTFFPCIWHRNTPLVDPVYNDIIEAAPQLTTRVKVTRTLFRGE